VQSSARAARILETVEAAAAAATATAAAASIRGTGIGTIAANFANGPWHAEVYSADTGTVPARFEDWGLRVADQYGENPGIGRFDVRTPGRWMLLMLREAGRSSGCSNANPFKGSLSDISFTSAP